MTTLENHLSAFAESACAIVEDGLAHARRDDPHKHESLLASFGEDAQRRLIVDFLAGGAIRVSLQIGDANRAIQVFATTVAPVKAH